VFDLHLLSCLLSQPFRSCSFQFLSSTSLLILPFRFLANVLRSRSCPFLTSLPRVSFSDCYYILSLSGTFEALATYSPMVPQSQKNAQIEPQVTLPRVISLVLQGPASAVNTFASNCETHTPRVHYRMQEDTIDTYRKPARSRTQKKAKQIRL
jgi:hypothetical protein